MEKNDLLEKKISTKFHFKIKNVSVYDTGIYNCSISNIHGESYFVYEIFFKCKFVYFFFGDEMDLIF